MASKAKPGRIVGTWDPLKVYGDAGRLSDAELLRWLLEREARVFALGAERARNPTAFGLPRTRIDRAHATAEQLLADRLTEIAGRVECFASTTITTPIAEGHTA